LKVVKEMISNICSRAQSKYLGFVSNTESHIIWSCLEHIAT
jgi:hypothetical protein